ncbi:MULTISPECIES: NADPH-dependent FMN reductase [Chryseobacterium]|uniref:NAD(P)H-dependent FMN reductase n=1 Tax=Chryseobacterium camelliae TaxID=1265445 RepID=A0ABU0TJS7_9FLAO|nr:MULTISPECIES: NAD(P)H-dependent oxidoreductase [Chryseobacterium]MDT3408839.1 NAD(P)H-dependent FMN reductase [Pseudacidovorax intermedius]MDQ1097303.1 NAD(P)H-dependent FMN reductase [Chryseobacterium camelliae]MDQ1101236.1 NAD(P)H-dependent FMN reductase [Chryseobacterium sp. SORGH_AS_1048]MDR6084682.1 NAD(P)H-dependent FMN reductase [Chryseobacterium sp. SORGH_AS_0909]MDR6132954.1 NAD(P)H-dependent FMN reductase [Chryseobacterium sp. SORGH_AS_1175]
MKILAFAGSTSSTSINRELVKFVLKDFRDEETDLIDLNDFAMPVFSVDLEKKGFPDEAHLFLSAIGACDAIICSLAEHNRSYSAAFKNIFDWASRINVKVFQNKPMLLMSTSPGGYGGGNVMNTAKTFFPQFGADIRQTFSLPKFYENFDAENGIINPDLLKELKDKTEAFRKEIHQPS